jgi:hypothetical protein
VIQPRALTLCVLCLALGCDGPDLIVGALRVDAALDADTDDGAAPTMCSDDGMCVGEEAHCNASGQCVECLTPAHCVGGEHPLCNVNTGECVDCLTHTDCPDNLFCQLPEGECEDTP